MYEFENNPIAEQEVNLPEDNLNNSNNNIYNENSRLYHTVRNNQQIYLNNNSNDSYYNRTSPRNRDNYKLDNINIIPHRHHHHHHHILHVHHHCHTPCHTHSTSKSRSGSYSHSPSPNKNFSQPLINPNLDTSNQSKLIYIKENINNTDSNNFNYDDMNKNHINKSAKKGGY